MPETREQLIERETKILAAIDKVRSSQEWRDGRMSVARGQYSTLLQELREVQAKIETMDARSAGGSWNLSKFGPI